MITIDEAIAHAREKAEEIRENIIDGENLEPYESYCNEMAGRLVEEHEQLAEWLEELKARRESDRISDSKSFDVLLVQRYNKAIDDFTEQLKAEYKPCEKTDEEIYKKVCIRIEKIAEQLKEGD